MGKIGVGKNFLMTFNKMPSNGIESRAKHSYKQGSAKKEQHYSWVNAAKPNKQRYSESPLTG